MTFSEKLERMHAHLSELGLKEAAFAPPLYRLLWRLGIEVPPPLFSSFASIAMIQGALFGIGWGALMWFAFWSRQNVAFPWQLAVAAALLAALLFGLFMAAMVRRQARRLGLPLWHEYHGKP